jgi:EmrB/QacA subfamily drug resistance transporter
LVPLLVLISGMLMALLDMTIVNVAIPRIQTDFGASTDEIQWITTAFNLALGVVVPLSGWLSDRFGTTRVYLISLVGFSIASILCGLAWDLNSMIVFRVLQAIPGGIIPVVTMTMLYAIVPRDQMGSAMGLYGLGVVFGPAIGPTLGGYLVEYVDWRLIFFINAPIGVLGTVAGVALLPKLPATAKRPLDWWGFATAGFGLFALLLAFSKAEDWGWSSYKVLILVTAGVFSLAFFVVIQLGIENPLIDLRVFKNWMYVNSLLLIIVLMVGLNAVLFYLPLYMQTNLGIQPLDTGLILLPEAIVMGILMPIAGPLYDRFGPRWPGVIGLTIASVGGFMLCGIGPSVSNNDIVLWTVIRAAGNGLALMPIMTAGLAAIPPHFTSAGSAMNNIAQRASASMGLAIMTAIATSQQGQLMADQSALIPANSPASVRMSEQGTSSMYGYYLQLQGMVTGRAYSNVFLVCALLTMVGIVLAFFMRKPPLPGPTESPEPFDSVPHGDHGDLAVARSGSASPADGPELLQVPNAPVPVTTAIGR